MSANRRGLEPRHTFPETAYEVSVRQLAKRELSSLQLRQKLTDRGFEDDAIEAAVRRLTAHGALDDRRVALSVARRAALVQLRGRARIEPDLQALGIAAPIIDEVLRELFTEVDEAQLLERALDRCLRASASSKPRAARVYRQLVARGFNADAVEALLERRHLVPHSEI